MNISMSQWKRIGKQIHFSQMVYNNILMLRIKEVALAATSSGGDF